MKIAHVIEAYYPDFVYQEGYLAREQRRRGHDVVLLTRQVHGNDREALGQIVQGRGLVLLLRLAGSLRRHDPDVVHVHNVVTQISVAACILKPLFGYRLVVDSHSSILNTRVNTPLRRLGATVFGMTVGRLVRRAADAVFAVGGPERAFTATLLGCERDEIGLVPLGVDTDVFHPDPHDRAATRSRLDLEDDFVVVHAGRLTPEKGVDVLLTATERIGATAVLVGSPDDRLRATIARFRDSGARILLPGIVDKNDVASLLRAADVGVWVGLISVSAVEAMAVGVPLITRDSQHYRELLGADHELVAADVDQLTRMLVELRDNPQQAATIGSRNAERAARSLEWRTIADRVELMYA